ncbi:GvpL/GvpF family gas vesicle protein [Peterkaempfera griseoplana]|uniref:GvpL/GvpF family gas vesicle protein n=1 Tax=Peterkaempfera griseoplana TaxID=66896 RepID=UPI0006E22725|nr:GvpL/GvpF family gas vesicle protein [Peterkaempfera griseoplana]
MAVYVYSVVAADHPLRLNGLDGVGNPPSKLRTVRDGDLVAVVSDTSGELRPKRRDLGAHQAVQERLMADGTVLPLQFGLTAPDDDAVREALAARNEEYTRRLADLEGCAEYHIKASQEEAALLRRILLESDDARALNDRIIGGDRDPELPLALGEMIMREVQRRQDAMAAAAVDALSPFAREVRGSPPTGQDFLNASFLVGQDDEERFLSAEKGLSADLGEGVDLRLRGPLPPYSFV